MYEEQNLHRCICSGTRLLSACFFSTAQNNKHFASNPAAMHSGVLDANVNEEQNLHKCKNLQWHKAAVGLFLLSNTKQQC